MEENLIRSPTTEGRAMKTSVTLVKPKLRYNTTEQTRTNSCKHKAVINEVMENKRVYKISNAITMKITKVKKKKDL
jgi:hypothetical protein